MNKVIKKILAVSVVLSTCFSIASAVIAPDEETLAQINKLMTERKFREAIPLLEKVIEKEPANSDANFKLGLCYYFSPDQRNLSLEYFRKAMGNINSKYAFNKTQSTNAPVDIYFFLGEAFLNNHMPDSALFYYVKYRNKVKQGSPFDLDLRINWCANSMKEMSTPLNVSIENLGNNINTKYYEKHPVVTLDNSVLFFSSNRPVSKDAELNEDIYYSIKTPSGSWIKPVYFQHNTSGNEYPVCLSLDGKMLILAREEKDNYDLFYSLFENSQWTKPVSMSGLNSSANETGASLSKDGNTIYFASDRSGGYGKYDIYMSGKTSSGKWGAPVNAGENINTPDNEISPYVHPEGRIIYFSSDGYAEENMGGFDIFSSALDQSEKWSKPVHMKYPVNTSRDDVDYQIASGGRRYYTSLTDFNSFDVVEITGQQGDADNIDFGTGTSGLFSELNVMEVMEVEKEVEKEVQVADVVEVQTEVEKEVQVVETVEVEKNPEPGNFSLESVNLEEIDSTARELLIQKVKDYYSERIGIDKSVIFKTIYFSFNSAELLMLSKNELRVLVEYLKENPTVKVEVIGHTDITGNWDVNLNVSRERAGSVYRFLLENGIAHNRIIYYGKGSAAPVASNNTIDGRAKNRRVEILLLK